MRAVACAPILLLISAGASAEVQIYKCKEAKGSILYTDLPCAPDAETLAILPKGSTLFQAAPQWDPLAEDDLDILAAQERDLVEQLRAARHEARSLQETTEAYALRRQILSLLKSVRRQKTEVLSRGVAPEEGEELVPQPDH